ncbi:MAG: hypothetical protein GC188_10870 [Alphaproteobacteria bacterium]|nr:hypothetical protein [Alphaproteobacteria bacterium]
MPTATIELPDGTKISIDGDVDEIAKITQLYNQSPASAGGRTSTPHSDKPSNSGSPAREKESWGDDGIDIPRLVERIKDCDEAEVIESAILDQRDVMPRVLLPFYIGDKYFEGETLLTSGEVEKITDQLGVKVPISSASRMLSDTAKKYVSGDAVRKKGAVVHYKLNRRGVQYMQDLLS